MRRLPVITVPLQNHFALKQRLLSNTVFFLNSSLHSHQEQGTRKTLQVANNREVSCYRREGTFSYVPPEAR